MVNEEEGGDFLMRMTKPFLDCLRDWEDEDDEERDEGAEDDFTRIWNQNILHR